MQRSKWRWLALVMLLVSGLASCGKDSLDPVEEDPGVSVGGIRFRLAGGGYSTASGVLPAPDATVAAPVVAIAGSISGLATAQLNVSGAEPFQTVLLLPVGAPSYVRVVLPGTASLIGIGISRDAASSFLATQLQVAIVRGGKVSAPTTISLLTPVN